MGTILKFLLIALAVLWLLYSPAVRGKILGRPAPGKSPKPSGAPPPPSPPAGPLDTMVACAHCGMHLPATEALSDAQGRPFCSPAHRDRART
jgi:uncharacterized protein